MNHPHSDQSVHHVCQRRLASAPHTHLVNASVSPLDHHSSVRIPAAQRNDGSTAPGHTRWSMVRSSPAPLSSLTRIRPYVRSLRLR